MAKAKRRNPYSTDELIDEAGDEIENGQEEAEQVAATAVRNAQNEASVMSHHAANAAFDALDMFGRPLVKVLEQNRIMMRKMMQGMHEESLRFVNRRLEHASHAIESTRDCRDVGGLLAVQQEWFVDMARDYAEQSSRLAEMMRELLEEGTAGWSEITATGRHAAEGSARREQRAAE